MNVHFKNITVQTVLVLLCFMAMPQIAMAKVSTTLGSTFMVGVHAPEEIELGTSLTNMMTSYASRAGYTAYNWYRGSTTQSNIYEAANGVGESGSISFYIGHGQVRTVWLIEDHYDMITQNGDWVADDWIYPHSANRNLRFVCLWACHLGDKIGGTHFWSGAYGMPHCWLHTTDLSGDGYASPDGKGYTFIGFSGITCWLHDDYFTEDETFLANASYYFLRHFYYAALYLGQYYSIKQALDFAVNRVWGAVDFGHSFLYRGYTLTEPETGEKFQGQMKVYGDGNKHLSDLRCAMKTRADGYFYIPTLPTSPLRSIKIEKLFDNANLVGDQTGGTSPYGTVKIYPDGNVNIQDISLIASKLGLSEGNVNWEYMADVVPDKITNNLDLAAVAANFGKSGTYITNLAGVHVRFNTGQEISPDPNGLVQIPQGATSFDIKKNGNPIGAMVIYEYL